MNNGKSLKTTGDDHADMRQERTDKNVRLETGDDGLSEIRVETCNSGRISYLYRDLDVNLV